jgi:hypothetical protein
VDEDNGFPAVELCEYGIELDVPEVVTVAVGQQRETIAALFRAALDLLDAEVNLWYRQECKVSKSLRLPALEMRGERVGVSRELGGEIWVPRIQMSPGRGD